MRGALDVSALSSSHARAVRRALEEGDGSGILSGEALESLVRRAVQARRVFSGDVPAGGATGQQAASYMRNLPPAGSFQINPMAFYQATERNDFPLPPVAFNGFGLFQESRINNVGVLAQLQVTFEGTITTTTTPNITPTWRWPYGLLSLVQFNANGQNNLIAVDGMDLKARERRVFRNPPDMIDAAPMAAGASPFNTAGSAAVKLSWVIPIAHDMTTLIAPIFAQSDESYLSYRLSFANQPGAATGDLFTIVAGTVALAGNFFTTLTFFEIPITSDGKSSIVVLPDLSMLHGMGQAPVPITNGAGDTIGQLLRTAGQLLCVYNRLDNGAASIDPFNSATLTEYRLRYGGNQIPRDFTHSQLSYKNQQDYDGPLNASLYNQGTIPAGWLNALPRYLLLDLETDNPVRDVIMPKGVIDLQQIFTLAGVTPAGNAQAHVVEEILFGGGA